MTQWLVDISIGPIQHFVGQSRRTRDLWGSSYLLSFLCAHAAMAVVEEGTELLQPDPANNRFCQLVCKQRAGEEIAEEVPAFASVPNHIVIRTTKDPEHVADRARHALQQAWHRVAEAVWQRFVEPWQELGNQTRAIWDRQVDGFWEFLWVATAGESPGLLARRKLIRDHQLPPEPGDKCMVMPDFQELSGHARPGGREAQQQFWEAIRRRVGLLDLRDNERLCAIALIKRLYPLVPKQALGWRLDLARFPSTMDVAAWPWLSRVSAVTTAEVARYTHTVKRYAVEPSAPPELSESAPPPSLVRRTGPYEGRLSEAAKPLARLHPQFYYRNLVRDPRLCPLPTADPEAHAELFHQLTELQGKDGPDGQQVGAPPVFYALLLADGDRLRDVLQDWGRSRVGAALNDFTNRVKDIVSDCHGFVVYAGGDDVLAMLPVPEALECAASLATAYRSAFMELSGKNSPATLPGPPPTLSVAVLFSHMSLALTTALREAHRLLDEVAKDRNGRNSLAVEVLKRGGSTAQWVSCWQRDSADGTGNAVTAVRDLMALLGENPYHTMLFRVRHTLVKLLSWWDWQPGAVLPTPDGLDLASLIQAEIGSTLDHMESDRNSGTDADQASREFAARLGRQLATLLRPAYGPQLTSEGRGLAAGNAIHLDVLPLLHFLSTGGREEEHEW